MAEVEKAWSAVCELIYSHNNFNEPSSTRQRALEELEKFREQSPYVIPVGFSLAGGAVHANCLSTLKLQCQQYGFYLLSDRVISKWEQTSANDKRLFKSSLMQLIEEKLDETWPRFMKDACAKVVVELAKREWPQQWPDMVGTLYNIFNKSTSHQIFVMMVYLRLAEDIFELDSLLTLERRRDLRYSIVQTLENGFFSRVIDCFEGLNRSLKSGGLKEDEREMLNCVIDIMNEFFSWLPHNVIFAHNDRLIPLMLDAILSHPPEFKTRIVGALTNLFYNESCKSKPAILDFFCDALFETFQTAAVNGDYDFFKSAGRFFCALSPHIISLWETVKARQKLDIAFKYFTFLLELTRHPSQSISGMTMDMWTRLMRHVSVKQSEPMKKIIPELVPVLRLRLLKVGLPSLNNHITCVFSRQDFTSDEEFSSFFCLYRSQVLQLLIHIVPLSPDDIFLAFQQSIADCWAEVEKELIGGVPVNESESLLLATIDGASILVGTCVTALRTHIAKLSEKLPSGLDEVTLASFSSSAIGCMLRASAKVKVNLHLQVAYLDLLVRLCRVSGPPSAIGDPNYPVLLVAIEVIDALEETSRLAVKDRPVDWMRQRCYIASYLTELATTCGQYLIHYFATTFYPRLWRQLEVVSHEFTSDSICFRADICLMCESLVLFGNHLPVDDRAILIRSLISVVDRIFSSYEPHLASTFAYARFIGLQGPQPASDNSSALFSVNEYIHRQNNLRFSARLLAGILRRFSGDVASELHPLLQPLLPRFLAAIQVSMAIWAPDERSRAFIRPELMTVFDVSETDRRALLGLPTVSSWARSNEVVDPDDSVIPLSQAASLTDAAVIQKYRNYVTSFADFSFQLLAHFAKIFGTLFYSTPNVGSELSAVLFTGLSQYPVPLLKTFIRHFLRPFATNCPAAAYSDAVVPLLRPFVAHVNQLLKQRWVDLQQSSESRQNEQAEIVETETTRLLTQEYLSFCNAILVFNPMKLRTALGRNLGSDAASMDGSFSAEHENENTMDGTAEVGRASPSGDTGQKGGHGSDGQPLPSVLSDLGRLLFTSHLDIGAGLLETAVVAVGWPDTWSCSRAMATLRVILPVILSELRLLPEQGPGGIMACIARGFVVNGQHEEMRPGLISLVLVAYEYASLGGYRSHATTLKELAGWSDTQLSTFENDVAALSEAQKISKTNTSTTNGGSQASQNGGKNKPSTRKVIRDLKNRLSNVLTPLVGRPASKLFARNNTAPITTPAGTTTVAPAPGAKAEEKGRRRAEQMLQLDSLFT